MPTFRSTPFTVPVRDILHKPGEQRDVTRDIPVTEKLGEGLAVVSVGEDLHVDLRLESVYEGILVSGEVSTTADATCARCLQPFRMALDVEFQELFAYSLGDGFDFEIHDEHVDLEPVIRDSVVLALPFQPIDPAGCEPTPLGNGIRLVLSDEEPVPLSDPRWGALAGFTVEEEPKQT